MSARPAAAAVWAVIGANMLWVVGSALVLLVGGLAPTPLGYAFVTLQAAAVFAFAEMQFFAPSAKSNTARLSETPNGGQSRHRRPASYLSYAAFRGAAVSTHLETLRWQFDFAWRLAGVHLPHLTDEACLWEPTPGAWTVRRSADGHWRPDWSDAEPDPAPAVTIGWLTWHWIWWHSALLAAMRNEARAPREQVFWPGSAQGVVQRLESLAKEQQVLMSSLREEELEKPLTYPWSEPRALHRVFAWANMEMMKNVAEIGAVRHLFEARRRG